MKVWILTMSCASGRAAGEFQLTVWDFELPLGATCIRIRQMATIILAKECSFTLARMPEFKGTLPSLRLKWIREGVEDYEYIELMKKAGKSDAALELARHPCGFPALERRSETPIRSTKANGRSTG